MFASIDEAVEYWKDELSYVDDAKVTGYVGGGGGIYHQQSRLGTC